MCSNSLVIGSLVISVFVCSFMLANVGFFMHFESYIIRIHAINTRVGTLIVATIYLQLIQDR